MEFSPHLETTLHRALESGSVRRQASVGLDHLALALLDDPDASAMLRACGVDPEELRPDLLSLIAQGGETVAGTQTVDPSPTAEMQRVVQRAILHVQSSGREMVHGGNVMVALFSERDSAPVALLKHHDMSRLDAVSYLSHGGAREVPAAPSPVDRDFFISYASPDEAFARDVDNVLRAAGFTTVVQFNDFVNSGNFVRDMQHGLARSARLIVLLSPAYEASDHCRAEWAAGYAEDPAGRKRKLVSFLIAPTELNPLARQVVYTSLVGLDLRARHVAILDAIHRVTRPMTRSDAAREAARVASPDVQTLAGRLDAVPNGRLDRPFGARGLEDLPQTLRTLAAAAIGALPPNAPPVIGTCLQAYGAHLEERGAQPIMGLIGTLAAAIERELNSVEAELWGPGLHGLLVTFIDKHGLLTTYFPKSEERERFFAETPIDEDAAVGEQLERPIREASEALEAVSTQGHTTPQFDRIVAGQRRQAADLASVPPSRSEDMLVVTTRRRFVLGSIGFYERVLSALKNTAQLADSPVVVTAAEVIRRSIEALLRLLP